MDVRKIENAEYGNTIHVKPEKLIWNFLKTLNRLDRENKLVFSSTLL